MPQVEVELTPGEFFTKVQKLVEYDALGRIVDNKATVKVRKAFFESSPGTGRPMASFEQAFGALSHMEYGRSPATGHTLAAYDKEGQLLAKAIWKDTGEVKPDGTAKRTIVVVR
jgi:hypothetical protein